MEECGRLTPDEEEDLPPGGVRRKDYLPSWMLALRLINWERTRSGIRTRNQEKIIAERHVEQEEEEETEAIKRRKKREEDRIDKDIEEYQKERDLEMAEFYAEMHKEENADKQARKLKLASEDQASLCTHDGI